MTETYRRWRLPELWQMIAADTPANTYLHLSTLRRQQTALETQRDRLRTLRDQLAQAWPPEKSEAATAFIQQLNDMIDAITLTARGAGELRANLVHVVDAITQARAEIAPLVADYDRANTVADARVGRQAQRLLDERARRILVGADSTVAQASKKLDVPLPEYARFSSNRQEEAASTVPSTTATATPLSTSAGNHNNSVGRTALSQPQFDPPAPVLRQDGFELTGVHFVDESDSSAPSVSPAVTGPPARAGVTGGWVPDGSSGGGLVLRGPVVGLADPIPARTAPPVEGRPVVGGPAAGRAVPTAGGAGSRSAVGSRPGSAAATQRSHGHRDQSFETYSARRREPRDDHGDAWSVKEGVAPLIVAPEWSNQDHDPGPGVLGIDR